MMINIITEREHKELCNYFEKELFKTIFILHPQYAVDGKLSKEKLNVLKSSGTEVFIILDRNIYEHILSAVKKGAFNGLNRRKITAFIIWATYNGFNLSPYDATKEQAFVKRDNISGNKELNLFNYLFDEVTLETVIRSFFYENVNFTKKSYIMANANGRVDFLNASIDFLFLYASMLHFVYVLRSESNPDIQFEQYFKWYFKESLISIHVLTYVILYFSQIGIQPPHWYCDNNKAIQGCINEAMDLEYLESINNRRYPAEYFTILLATQDKNLKKVFEVTYDERTQYLYTFEEYFDYLCKNFSDKKRTKYVQILLEQWRKHQKIESTKDVAIKLVIKEEKQLRALLFLNK